MQLMPKRVKHRKEQRGKNRGDATRGNRLVFGDFGLQAMENGQITARQIEAGRVAASHFLGTAGRIYIRIFPAKPVTATPAETRMGKGKGEPEFWAAPVKPGTILYEIAGVSEEIATRALYLMSQKMPIKVRRATRRPM
jgi:large subunit ribosomal protein L16